MESLQTIDVQGAVPGRAAQAEDALLTAACAGDGQAYEAIITAYQSRVQRRCLRRGLSKDEAEDVTQDVFIKVYRNLSRYQHRHAFATWLDCVTDHACIDHFRQRQRRQAVMQPILTNNEGQELELPGRIADPEAQFQAERLGAQIGDALAALPPMLREAFELKELEGLRYERIAVQLGVTVGTVKSRIHRARRLLMDRLQGALE